MKFSKQEYTKMMKLNEYLKANVKPYDFEKLLKENRKVKLKLNLNEADEDEDIFGDDMDDGGEMGEIGGFDSSDDSSDESTGESTPDTEVKEKDHEVDPDFIEGIKGDTPVLDKSPAGETIYDSESVMRSIKGVTETLKEEQLVEMDKVKNALELIFTGKKLNPEDLDFDNIQNAIFILGKIAEPLDDKTRNYMTIKLKQPLILARDQNKLELAKKNVELNKKRDTILNIDKINVKK